MARDLLGMSRTILGSNLIAVFLQTGSPKRFIEMLFMQPIPPKGKCRGENRRFGLHHHDLKAFHSMRATAKTVLALITMAGLISSRDGPMETINFI